MVLTHLTAVTILATEGGTGDMIVSNADVQTKFDELFLLRQSFFNQRITSCTARQEKGREGNEQQEFVVNVCEYFTHG